MASFPFPKVLPPNNNAGPPLVDASWVLFGLSTVLMAGRLYSKIAKLRRFAVDDGLMLIAWATSLCFAAAVQTAFHHSLGRHWEYLTYDTDLALLKWAYVAQAFSIISPAFGRVAFCFYLLAVIGKARHVLRYPLYMFIVLQGVFNFTLLIALYAICGTNMNVIANPTLTCYRPAPWADFAFFVGGSNAVTDAFLTLAPSFMVWQLRTYPSVKLAAGTLLSLSILAFGAAIWRTVEIRVLFSRDLDITHDMVPYFIASAVELNVVIIATSVPTIGPIFKKRSSGKGLSSGSSGKPLSGDSGELQYNLGYALGIKMPKLGNSVTITGGPLARLNSGDDVLPLTPVEPAAIKKVIHADVSVSYSNIHEEELIDSLPPTRIAKY